MAVPPLPIPVRVSSRVSAPAPSPPPRPVDAAATGKAQENVSGCEAANGSGSGSTSSADVPRQATTSSVSTAPATSTTSISPPVQPMGIPTALAVGVPMLKVSSKKIKPVNVRLSPSTITWPSLKGGKVEITAIRELRFGQSPTDEYDGARWITIVYVRDKQWKVVHLIARTDDVYQLWVKALHELVSESSDKVVSGAQGPASDPETRFIRQLWPAGTTALDRGMTAGLCAQLGLVVPPQTMCKYEFPLDLPTFRQLVRDVQRRPELGEIYQALGASLTRERVHMFLRDVQEEKSMDVDAVFERYARDGEWSAESLASYLSSADNVPNRKQDLTRPLPEYYIASSHNTYLVAEQWRGSSTVEGYIRTLLAGCRSVEIDCHDGGSEGPIVYHGMTITSSVPVRDVCQAINKYAFVSSPYPVILSLEIRCGVEQQDKLATIIKECFGERLVTEPLDLLDKTVPSPADLKGRVLIKTKPMPPPPTKEFISSKDLLSMSPPSMSPPLLAPSLSTSPPNPANDSTTDSTTESDSSFVKLARRLSFSRASAPSNKTPQGHARSLTDLPVYTSAVKYKGFSKLVSYDYNHMFSVSERTAHRILKDGQGPDWIKHNFNHLTRVYPKGVRLTSSNFDPRPFWLSGAQLVAINYQTQDAGSMYNDALFHQGGYVLKPLCLRQKTNTESPQQYRLRMRIITAQRLPPMGDLYVEVTVGDETLRTKSTKNTSLTPRWDEVVEFTFTSKPCLVGMTFVHVEIREKRGIVAQWTRRLEDTGRGYRYLPLRDRDRMKYLFATLFARIDVLAVAAKPVAQQPPPAMFNAVLV